MSRLRIFDEYGRLPARIDTTDGAEIGSHLRTIDVTFERFAVADRLEADVTDASILSRHSEVIDRLRKTEGYAAADVVRVRPGQPGQLALRGKFLDEHTHDEDEVRLFVEGSGYFCLHVRGEVYTVLCQRGDLIGVPAGTPHWFDMGDAPAFTAIRLFTNPAGWVGRPTGSAVARQFQSVDPKGPAAVLVDVEGTTSSLAFVRETLFPWARQRLAAHMRVHRQSEAIVSILEEVRRLADRADLDDEAAITTLCRWSDEDKKVGPLKRLQGLIWQEGYAAGQLRGHVYQDAVARLGSWRAAGHPIYVFSSGSIAAQRLLFAHSSAGDLTPLLAGHFDTTTGAKTDSSSYRRIAQALDRFGNEVLFLSDSLDELDAAAQVGMRTVLIARDADGVRQDRHEQAASFMTIEPSRSGLRPAEGLSPDALAGT